MRVVKAFAWQPFEREKFDGVNWEKYQRGCRLLIMHAVDRPITDIMCVAQLLLGYGIAATMAINGTITVGTYTAYAGLLQFVGCCATWAA